MIEINCSRQPYVLEITGHAGYAEEGKDIICAGVSTLFFTLLNSLEECATVEHVYRSGYARLAFSPYGRDAEIMYNMAINGLEAIAENYPDYVKFLRG